MRFENPWWETNQIEDFYLNMKSREYYKLLFPLVVQKEIKRAVVLMGPRRVGKTVLIFHTIKGLIETGVDPKKICYLSVETPIYNGIGLDELLSYYFELFNRDLTQETYIFFDEIQYLKEWEVHLKSLVDSYHNIKFVVSGSAAAALKLKSAESGAGRFTEFILPPLTFHEYLSLLNNEHLITMQPVVHKSEDGEYESLIYTTNNIKELNEHFVKYINFGGYPEVSLSKTIQENPSRYIRNDIIDKVLLRDLPLLYGIEDIQELNSLFTYIAYNTGNEMSLDSISNSSGVSKNTIKKYLSYLEAAFLIKTIHRVDQSGKKFMRANFFKVYLTNPSLHCALFSPTQEDDSFMGNLVETTIFSQWQHSHASLYYARWSNGEVDIAYLDTNQKPSWAVEVKWSNKPVKDYDCLKNIIYFCGNHKIDVCTVTTYDYSGQIEKDNMTIDFIPSALYCYMVGRNVVYYKKV